MKTCLKSQVFLGALIPVLTGCSMVPTQFGGSWPLPAERQSSAALDLVRPVLSPKPDGGILIVGYLVRQHGGSATENSHVDMRFFAKDGTVLSERSVEFQPRDLLDRVGRGQPHARYELLVPDPPNGTFRIQVIARDQLHTPNGA